MFWATPKTVLDLSWYADSGVTNHVTVKLENLSMKAYYKRQRKAHDWGWYVFAHNL